MHYPDLYGKEHSHTWTRISYVSRGFSHAESRFCSFYTGMCVRTSTIVCAVPQMLLAYMMMMMTVDQNALKAHQRDKQSGRVRDLCVCVYVVQAEWKSEKSATSRVWRMNKHLVFGKTIVKMQHAECEAWWGKIRFVWKTMRQL